MNQQKDVVTIILSLRFVNNIVLSIVTMGEEEKINSELVINVKQTWVRLLRN
ncbi:hypothetical protein Pecwa_2423 [Pectobacterium parmentieri WPP163]|uniref:Uncharacterized protein n=1 Tax=Pectobacterium parmentieri TaxID=1905730 RepID=A0A0H3I5G6_PECPM|nr:hypothetical protein Pecwa_2423 [Pectobacterium parmentieri WPP163]AFI90489.1 Hypothetical protein W5S_2401 [Pectobacterium parmentieri]POW26965.1 hypothetical protein PB20LOC_02280 [Pectobacterium parmentieri]